MSYNVQFDDIYHMYVERVIFVASCPGALVLSHAHRAIRSWASPIVKDYVAGAGNLTLDRRSFLNESQYFPALQHVFQVIPL